MSVFSAAALLFLVLDPLGNIPLFTCMFSAVDRRRHYKIIVRELLIALGILVMFLFAGRHILALLQISQSSLGIAGGIILLMIAIKMVFSGSEKIFENTASKAAYAPSPSTPSSRLGTLRSSPSSAFALFENSPLNGQRVFRERIS